MLHLYIDHKEAVLPDDFEVTLNLQNDFLNDRSEDATYPFTLSVSANRHILGFSDRVNNHYYKSSFSARIFFGPFILIEGLTYIDNIEGDQVELYIMGNSKGFWEQAGDMNFFSNHFSELYEWTSEAYRKSLSENLKGVFAPLLLNDGRIVNSYGGALADLPDIPRPFPRIRALLYYYIEKKLNYSIIQNSLDSVDWFNNLLLVYLGSYTFSQDYPLPRITLKDLIEEIERRFALRFLIDDIHKRVKIVHFSDTLNAGVKLYLHAYNNPQISFRSRNDYNKNYAFSDKRTDDKFVAVDNSEYPFPLFSWINYEKTECSSTQIGSNHTSIGGKIRKIAAVDESLRDPDDHNYTDYRLGIYKGFVDGYPLMDAEELFWDSLYRNFHKDRVSVLKYAKSITFTVCPDTIEILQNLTELFDHPVVMNYRKYLSISADITMSHKGISAFELKCIPL